MTKDEILAYVMNSPENTNYSVLKDMLNRITGEDNEMNGIKIFYVTWDEDPLEITAIVDLDNNPVSWSDINDCFTEGILPILTLDYGDSVFLYPQTNYLWKSLPSSSSSSDFISILYEGDNESTLTIDEGENNLIHFYYSNSNYSCSHTFEEIRALIRKGIVLFADFEIYNSTQVYTLITYDSSTIVFSQSGIYKHYEDGQLVVDPYQDTFTITSDNVITKDPEFMG